MPRHRRQGITDDLFDIFCAVAWWVGPVVAAGVYALLLWVFPNFVTANEAVAGLIRYSAPWVTALIIIIWLPSLFFKYRRRHLLLRQTGLDSIRALSWQEVEKLIGEVYRRQGFAVFEHGGPAPDGGIDLVLQRAGIKTLVQCKHWKSRQVGVSPVRELYGVMAAEAVEAGILVTTGEFTRDAADWARGKKLQLVNGTKLWELAQPFCTNQPGQHAELVAAKPLVPSPEATQAAVSCPLCRGAMILKTARRGSNAGSQFWGCATFPQCRGSRKV